MNYSKQTIHFFRSERNRKTNNFFNPSKFYVGTVDEISFDKISIQPFVGVIDDVGNRLDITAKEIHSFEKGKTARLTFEWDTIFNTSFYVRESELTDEEKRLIEISENYE